jgi:hypothetical protein
MMGMNAKKFLIPALVAQFTIGAAAQAQEALRVTVDTDKSELVIALEPVVLPAGGHHSIEQPRIEAVTMPINAYLHGFTVELIDRHGRELPPVLLHHMNIIAPERRELFSQIMQRVGAAGAETGTLRLPRWLGYPVSRGDSLVFSAMLHNPTPDAYAHVEMRVRMKYSSLGTVLPRIPVQPFYMDVMPPAGVHAYTLPPGRSSRSWEGSPAVPGRILGVGGHMHKYGVLLRFENVTKGKVLWEATPVVDSTGAVVSMPRKFWRLGIQLDPAHTYRLTAEYDNPTGDVIEHGAMGTLGGIFAPDERASWPEVDRDHPEYRADLDVTYARNSGGGTQHHH